MPKDSLKDKLEGNELDLSLSNLDTIPVKELAVLPRATNLDLSCNLISSLPDGFCSLTHLVKIDLSKNSLTELPANFGDLQNLQHLDLLGNQLTLLPVSFWQLKKLKWLDLKDNPLDETLKPVVGDCLDEIQCRKCAQQVVLYLKSIHNEIMKIEQERYRREKEKKEALKAKEDLERLQKKEQKKVDKERKRQEWAAKQLPTEANSSMTKDSPANLAKEDVPRVNGLHKEQIVTKERSQDSWFWTFLSFLVIIVAILAGIYFFCDQDKKPEICQTYWEPCVNSTQIFLNVARQKVMEVYQSTKDVLGL